EDGIRDATVTGVQTCALPICISDVIDGDNRRTSVLASPSRRQVSLFGPSPFAWLGLPRLDEAQYVMTAARFAEPEECLRFTVERSEERRVGKELSVGRSGVRA